VDKGKHSWTKSQKAPIWHSGPAEPAMWRDSTAAAAQEAIYNAHPGKEYYIRQQHIDWY
jgi:hypothetical protein